MSLNKKHNRKGLFALLIVGVTLFVLSPLDDLLFMYLFGSAVFGEAVFDFSVGAPGFFMVLAVVVVSVWFLWKHLKQ